MQTPQLRGPAHRRRADHGARGERREARVGEARFDDERVARVVAEGRGGEFARGGELGRHVCVCGLDGMCFIIIIISCFGWIGLD